jgi:hypothetical protein
MVRLWLFLNDDVTENDLYEELYNRQRRPRKTNYRVFSGTTKTVDARLEKIMEQKFLQQGLDRQQVKQWIDDLHLLGPNERIPYEEVKPILDYLEENAIAHPTRLLNQSVARYESGELKSVSREKYERILDLKEKAEAALRVGSRLKLEKLEEEVYGQKSGFVFFSELEEELEFLRKFARRGAKRYLGRSLGIYKRGGLRRIASWRAEKIREDCEALVKDRDDIPLSEIPKRDRDDLPLSEIPKHYLSQQSGKLIGVLQKLLTVRISDEAGLAFERQILMPDYHTREEYHSSGHGFVTIAQAADFWGMGSEAFDLLVATHSDVFRRVGKYENGWRFPDLYLEEVLARTGFHAVRSKYQILAKTPRSRRPLGRNADQAKSRPEPEEVPSRSGCSPAGPFSTGSFLPAGADGKLKTFDDLTHQQFDLWESTFSLKGLETQSFTSNVPSGIPCPGSFTVEIVSGSPRSDLFPIRIRTAHERLKSS